MIFTSPLQHSRALAIAALVIGHSSLTQAASYQLNLFAEANVGKYTFTPDATLASELGTYSDLAKSMGGTRYWSFCLEYSEHFQSGRTVNGESGLNAGGGSVTTSGDMISEATAYLFKEFASGNLGSVLSYDVTGGARLQNMIWFLEDESGGYSDPATQDPQLWSLISSMTDPKANYSGSEVGVLQTTKYYGPGGDSLAGTARQDQVVLWAPRPSNIITTSQVPDGGTTLLLLALSLGGIGLAKRSQKA